MSLLPDGKIFAGCRVVRLLGRGASGAIYEATQLSLDRPVALKVLAAEHASPEDVEALLAEARTLAQLDHPNIVRVFNAGREEGRAFLVMELLEGETLLRRLRRAGALSAADALRIAGEVARGLRAAHRHGIVHRDLKASNIFLRADGRAKLIDFGLAAGASAAGRAGGTPEYMAPEQWRRHPADPRTDLYSLGLVLFRMLAGRNAFEGDAEKLQYGHLELPLRPPEPRPPSMDDRTFALIWRLCRKRLADRYADAADFLADIEAVLSGNDPRSLAEMGRVTLCPTCDTESPAGLERCPECKTNLSRQHMTTDDLLPEPPTCPPEREARRRERAPQRRGPQRPKPRPRRR
ncbi:MAG: serine/threonine protein kinase [Planctomycetes bacterium]|nr:serine/threonine protein kinase [Planctomycetota bacterium]